MKKLFALLLALIMVFALTACGNNETPSGSEGGNPGTSQNGGENNDGGWPNDDYTAHVPAPTFATFVKNTESETGNFFTGTYYFSLDEEVDIDAVKAYAEELQRMGFTENVKITDDPSALEYYTFKAKNPDTKVSVTLSMYIEHDDRDSSRKLTINIPK